MTVFATARAVLAANTDFLDQAGVYQAVDAQGIASGAPVACRVHVQAIDVAAAVGGDVLVRRPGFFVYVTLAAVPVRPNHRATVVAGGKTFTVRDVEDLSSEDGSNAFWKLDCSRT